MADAGHSANSDPWIVSHHDSITQMLPRVLVLNFANGVTSDAALATAQRQVNAIAEGSRYHGYSDPKAPVFLSYQIARVVDLTDHPVPAGWTNPSSTQLPVTPNGSFDPLALFSARLQRRLRLSRSRWTPIALRSRCASCSSRA